MLWPLIIAPSSEHRKATWLATSSGCVMRRSDTLDTSCARIASLLTPPAAARAAMTRSTRSPATTPGSTELTRMLDGPSSMAQVCVRPASPNLLALYGVRSEKPSRPATDEILMMAPPPAARSSGTAPRAHRKAPVRLTSSVWRQASSVVSSSRLVGPATPALLTSASSLLHLSARSRYRSSTCASDDTSATLTLRFGWLPARARQASASTSQACTRAPDARNLRTIARPMPLAPAVTRMCLSCRDRLMGISGCVWRGALKRRTRAGGRPCAAGP